MEATSIRETTLAFRPAKQITRPLDIVRAVEAEILRRDRALNAFPFVKLSEAEKIMMQVKCTTED